MRLEPEAAISFALGVNDSTAPSEYQPQELARLINGRVSRQGNSVRRRGVQTSPHPFSTFTVAAIDGAIEYRTAAGVQQAVVFTSGKMYTSTNKGVTWTERASGLSAGKWSLVIIREGTANVLCAANGGTSSYQWDGTTWGTIANIPANVKYLAVHGQRLVAAGHSGVDVVASKVSDIDTWAQPDGWTIKATTHDGDTEITGLFQLGSVIMVFKRKSVGYVEGFGFNTLQVETGSRGISRSSGCVAFRSIQAIGDTGMAWLSEDGFEFYEVGGRVTLISDRMQSFVNSILMDVVLENPSLPCSLWWPKQREYWCAVPVAFRHDTNGTLTNNHIFVFRPGNAEGPSAMWVFNWSDQTNPETLTLMTGTLSASGAAMSGSGDSLGYLLLDDDLGTQYFTTSAGRLGLTEGNEYGMHAYLVDGKLAFEGNYGLGVTSLFVADGPTEIAAPWSGSSGGRVFYMEQVGDTDDRETTVATPRMYMRPRPFLFGTHFQRKKAKRLMVQSSQPKAAEIVARVFVDGVAGAQHTLSVPASPRRAVEDSARVGGRGNVVEVELRTDDDVEIVAVGALAQILDDEP